MLRNPNSRRPWQHVLEPLSGYIILAQKLYGKNGCNYSGAWNFGPNRQNHLKVKQFAKLFKKKLKSKSKIFFKKKQDKREKNFLDLESKKSEKKLKWRAILNIQQTLELTANWYLAYKNKENLLEVSSEQIKEFMKL